MQYIAIILLGIGISHISIEYEKYPFFPKLIKIIAGVCIGVGATLFIITNIK